MADALHDFGPIDEMKPEAIGIPGSRRFRTLFRQGNRTACFWMEKEQLGALGDAIQELLMRVQGGNGNNEPLALNSFPEPFEVEAQTGRLALGYNENADLFLILLYDLDTEASLQENAQSEEELERASNAIPPTIRVEVTRAQLERFYGETANVINSGRPPKPSKNGHFKAN